MSWVTTVGQSRVHHHVTSAAGVGTTAVSGAVGGGGDAGVAVGAGMGAGGGSESVVVEGAARVGGTGRTVRNRRATSLMKGAVTVDSRIASPGTPHVFKGPGAGGGGDGGW